MWWAFCLPNYKTSQMKTIEDLNSKVWYRFLKLIYVSLFMVLIVGFPVGFFVNVYSDPKINTYIKCENGKIIDSFDLLGFIPDKGLTEEELIAMGAIPMTRAEYQAKFGSVPTSHAPSQQTQKLTEAGLSATQIARFQASDLCSEADQSKKYDVIREKDVDWSYFLTYSLVSTLAILIIFEFLRRSFYYVTLGRVNPLKK